MSTHWQIPQCWNWVEMANISTVVGGGTPQSNDSNNFSEPGIPWITPADLSNFKDIYISRGRRGLSKIGFASCGAKMLPAGTVLMSSRAPIGYLAIAASPVCTNQGFKSFVPQDSIDSKYIFYFLKRARTLIDSLAGGTTFREISGANSMRIPVPVPPLPEQRRIVAEIEKQLTRVDVASNAITRCRKRFEAYLSSALPRFCALPPNLEDDGQAPLPVGWQWVRVRDIGEVKLGRQRAPQHHNGPHMRPYLRVANVFEDRIQTDNVLQMNFTPEEYEIFCLNDGDVLLNEGQSLELVGRPAIYHGEVPGSCFQNTLVRFRPSAKLTSEFALIAFRAYLRTGRFRRIAKWTTNIAHLGATRFADMHFPLPELSIQNEIVKTAEKDLTLLANLKVEVIRAGKRASRLRQAILAKAFSGQLVPQDPNDEPASVLLERIRKERATAAKKTSRRKRASAQELTLQS